VISLPQAHNGAGPVGGRAESDVEGRLEGVVDGRVLGWAWMPGTPRERVWVSVFVDEEPIGLVAADLQRPDLLAAGVGDGAHGFSVTLPPALRNGAHHSVRAMAGGANTQLPPASSFSAAIQAGLPASAQLDGERLRRHGPLAALVVGLLANLIVLLLATRHLGFFQDDYLFILQKRGWSLHTFLAPMNGHLSLMPVATFKLLFALVGIGHSWPYRLVCVALDSACVVAVYLLLAPRAGRAIALVPAALLLALGAGTGVTDLIWVTEIGFLLSLATGAGALLALRRGDRRGDRAAAALLTVSLASSSPGLAMCAGVFALLVAGRAPWRRLWVVAAPLGLYAVWYLDYGTQGLELSNLQRTPAYMVEIAGAALAALGGLSGPARLQVGIALLAILATAFAVRAWRGERLPALAAAGLTGALTFWTLVALTRAQTHNAVNSRYLYPSAVFIVICLGALIPWRRTTVVGAALTAGALAFVLVGDLGVMSKAVSRRGQLDEQVRVVLGASEMIGGAGSPSFTPNPPYLPFLTLGSYLAAVRQLGSPALTPGQIEAASPANRLLADRTLIDGEQVGLESPPSLEGTSAPTPVASSGIALARVGHPGDACLQAKPAAGGAWIELAAVPGSALRISLAGRGTVALYLRRLAAEYPPDPRGVLPSGEGARGVGFPVDASRLPWHVRLAPTTTLLICAVP
jgi:hypothetical protein